MRSFAIFLGCLAWVLSCFDAVSYYRAGTQQRALQDRLKTSTGYAASVATSAGQDSTALGNRLQRDQAAVENDQRAISRDGRLKLSDAQDQQTLSADQAALQADRMMLYTVENFARTDPDPRVSAAENRVDVDRRSLSEATATRKRDLGFSHVLIALWVLVLGTALIAFHGVFGVGQTQELDGEEEDEEHSTVDGELSAEDSGAE